MALQLQPLRPHSSWAALLRSSLPAPLRRSLLLAPALHHSQRDSSPRPAPLQLAPLPRPLLAPLAAAAPSAARARQQM